MNLFLNPLRVLQFIINLFLNRLRVLQFIMNLFLNPPRVLQLIINLLLNPLRLLRLPSRDMQRFTASTTRVKGWTTPVPRKCRAGPRQYHESEGLDRASTTKVKGWAAPVPRKCRAGPRQYHESEGLHHASTTKVKGCTTPVPRKWGKTWRKSRQASNSRIVFPATVPSTEFPGVKNNNNKTTTNFLKTFFKNTLKLYLKK